MSQTACPHCGSTSSIQTAGQRYCADCGQLIVPKTPAKKEIVKEVKKTPEKKANVAAQKAPVSKPKKAAPPLNLKAIEESRSIKTTAPKQPGTLDLRKAQPKPAAKKPIGKHVPPKTVVAPPVEQPQIPEPVIAEPTIEAVHIPVPSKQVGLFKTFAQSIRLGLSGKALPTALGATMMIAVCQLLYAAIFAKTTVVAVSESIAAGSVTIVRAVMMVDHAAWAILIGIIAYAVYQYSVAKITYRASIEYDRKNASKKHVRQVALRSLYGLTGLDVLNGLIAVLLIAAATAANIGFIGTKSLGWMGIALAMLVNIITVYLLLGMVAARLMGGNSVIMAQVGVWKSYKTGWALYMRQFGKLSGAIILMSLASVLFNLPAVLIYMAFGAESLVFQVLIGALVFISFAVLVASFVIFMVHVYQYIIAQEFTGEKRDLLSGAKPHQARTGRRLMGFAVMMTVIGASMTAVIANSHQIVTLFIR